MNPRRSRRPPILLLALACLASCAFPPKSNDWSEYDGPGAEYFRKEEVAFPTVRDPFEPVNRGMGAFNHALLVGVIRPLSAVWRFVFPGPVRTAAGNAFNNLLYPVWLTNNLLQGKLAESGDETKRFAIKTTVGILGIRDAATPRGIEQADEDFGKTLSS